MKKRALLITGGSGFIGRNFVLQELDRGEREIINLDALTYAANPEPLEHRGYHFQHGRIGDQKLVKKILSDHQVGAVVNFAAESHVDRSISDPALFLKTNVLETQALLEACLTHADEDFRFLHVSTDEVYGSLTHNDAPFSESTSYTPNSPYAASKAASDHLVRSYHHTYGLPVLTSNCSNNYGPYQFPEKLIPLMIQRALAEEPIPIYGNGSNIRDWLYVRDHTKALSLILEKGTPGETYCIGGDAERDNLSVAHQVCSLLNELKAGSIPYEKLITFVEDRAGHDLRYAINSSKLKGELGWKAEVSFEEGLRKTIQWYLP